MILLSGVTTIIVATPHHKIATKSVNGLVVVAVITAAREDIMEDTTEALAAREVKVEKEAVAAASDTKSVTPCATLCTPLPCRTIGRSIVTLWCRVVPVSCSCEMRNDNDVPV